MPEEESPIFMFDAGDPEMQAAVLRARETFKYFWRELFWEFRRIIPGLDVSAVKLPFADCDLNDEGAEIEQMWVNEIDFDGREVHGTLINSPNWLKSVQVGDEVSVPVGGISDWMYVVSGEVCGGFTVNQIRARMGAAERRDHDEAWGLDFGDPAQENLFPRRDGATKKSGGFLGKLFGKKDPVPDVAASTELPAEHPMGINMVKKYTGQLAREPEVLQLVDERGWTQLHHHALAGNTMAVRLFLEHGADPNALTPEGVSAEALARVLGWDELGDLLASSADASR